MARTRLPDVAIAVAAALLGAGTARQISVAVAGRDAADDARGLFARQLERGHGRFGPAYVAPEGELHGLRFDRVCANRLAPVGGRPVTRLCAVVRSGRGPARIIRIDHIAPNSHGAPR